MEEKKKRGRPKKGLKIDKKPVGLSRTRGKDVTLRKLAISSHSDRRAVIDTEAKEFLGLFLEKMGLEFREKSKVDDAFVSPGISGAASPYELGMGGLEYFYQCLKYNQPITKSGLGLFLRKAPQSISLLAHEEGYGDVVKRLTSFVEMYNETALHTRQNPVGAIFVLKNMGWSDNMDVTLRPAPNMSEEERAQARKRLSNFSE